MKYTTTCSALPDLDGSCEIVNDEITSYYSNNLSNATSIEQLGGGGSEVHAKLIFRNGAKYKVKAKANGSDFHGSAKEDNDANYEDAWTATAITVQPAAAGKGY